MNFPHPTVDWDRQQRAANGETCVLVTCPICDETRWAVAANVRFWIKTDNWTGRCYEHRNYRHQRECSIPECQGPVYGKGWCHMHWQRWYRTGDPLKVRPHAPNSSSFTKGQIPWNLGVPMAEETKLKLSLSKKGQTPWNKGKRMPEDSRLKMVGQKRSEATREKIRAVRALQVITPAHRLAISRANTGRTLSPEHVAKISGVAHYRFKGGISRNLSRKAWREVREATFTRDGYRCRNCGETDRHKLVAHHIIEFRDGGPDVLGNLITWCRPCHTRYHSTKIATA